MAQSFLRKAVLISALSFAFALSAYAQTVVKISGLPAFTGTLTGAPTTVMGSRLPRAFTRRTQKPLPSL